MTWLKRIFLFGIVNLVVIVTVSFILSMLGIGNYQIGGNQIDLGSLMVFCAIWGGVGSLISLMISKPMAKWSMGVRVIDPNRPASPLEAQLLQTVHSQARAAGLTKMPEVGVYQSPEVNAFATGPTRNNSLVAVSTGLINRMNKDAVEGVLGHEVAHIANGDMVTMALIQGVVNAFVMFFARICAHAVSTFLRRDGDERSSGAMNWILVMVFEVVFGLLAMMIVAAFSRYREYRADAGGAKLAGRGKMIAALEALAGTSQLVDTSHESLAALKISGKANRFAALFSTHPPLEDRIRQLKALRVSGV